LVQNSKKKLFLQRNKTFRLAGDNETVCGYVENYMKKENFSWQNKRNEKKDNFHNEFCENVKGTKEYFFSFICILVEIWISLKKSESLQYFIWRHIFLYNFFCLFMILNSSFYKMFLNIQNLRKERTIPKAFLNNLLLSTKTN